MKLQNNTDPQSPFYVPSEIEWITLCPEPKHPKLINIKLPS